MAEPLLLTAAEEILVHLLKVSADVQALVEFRIAPDQIPEAWKGKTCLVYELQQDKRQRLLSGAETGLTHSRYSIYCVDRNRGRSRLLAQVARAAIKVNEPTTISGKRVWQVFVPDGERDDSVPGTDGQDIPERYRTIDCVIHYQA